MQKIAAVVWMSLAVVSTFAIAGGSAAAQPAPKAAPTPPPAQAGRQPAKVVQVNAPLKLSAAEHNTLVAQWNTAAKAYKIDKNVTKWKQANSGLPQTSREVWAAWTARLAKKQPKVSAGLKAAITPNDQLGPWKYAIESAEVTGYWFTMHNCELTVNLTINLKNMGSSYNLNDNPPSFTAYPRDVFFDFHRINNYQGPKLLTGGRHSMNIGIQSLIVWGSSNCPTAYAQTTGYIDLMHSIYAVNWGGAQAPSISVQEIETPTIEEILEDLGG